MFYIKINVTSIIYVHQKTNCTIIIKQFINHLPSAQDLGPFSMSFKHPMYNLLQSGHLYLSVPVLCNITCRSLATHRGHIKKIKFGPGRGNNKLAALFSDGIDIWDLQKVF